MKRIFVAAVMMAVSVAGIGQVGSEQPLVHVAIAGEKLDSGVGNMVYGESLDSVVAQIETVTLSVEKSANVARIPVIVRRPRVANGLNA